MVDSILKCGAAGAAAGFFAGVLAGGVWASCFGQPFSGQKGMGVFHKGMVFPGLIVLAPGAAGAGAVGGAAVALACGRPKRDD